MAWKEKTASLLKLKAFRLVTCDMCTPSKLSKIAIGGNNDK